MTCLRPFLILFIACSAAAGVQTGRIVQWEEGRQLLSLDEELGVDTGIVLFWSIASLSAGSGFFYGGFNSADTETAHTVHDGDIFSLGDVSGLDFRSDNTGLIDENEWIFYRNAASGVYLAIRIDDIYGREIEGETEEFIDLTWFFNDGSPIFGHDAVYLSVDQDEAGEVITSEPAIDLPGSALAAGPLSRVHWTNGPLGGDAEIVGPGRWRVAGLPLADGENRIGIVAESETNGSGELTVIVKRQPNPDDVLSFPNDAFHAYLLETADANGDGLLSRAEGDAVRQIEIRSVYNVDYDLAGIEQLVNLETLTLYNIDLERLELSGLPALHSVDIRYCPVQNAKLAGLPALSDATLRYNDMTAFTLEDLPALRKLDLFRNRLTTLTFPDMPALEKLNCESNRLESFTLSDAPALLELNLDHNRLTSLRLSAFPALQNLQCDVNNLSDIALSDLPGLLELSIGYNELEALPAASLPRLETLVASGNPMTRLLPADLTGFPQLRELFLYSSVLQILDVSGSLLELIVAEGPFLEVFLADMPRLRSLDLEADALEALNLSYLPELETLRLRRSQLSSLTLAQLPRLTSVYASGARLSTVALEGLPALDVLDLSKNALRKLPAFPESLRYLRLDFNELQRIESLPPGLKTLVAAHNALVRLPPLPEGLTWLNLDDNRLRELPPLPPMLARLECGENRLESLPDLPSALRLLTCRANRLSSLQPLPASLSRLDAAENALRELPALPDNLSYLDASDNRLETLPEVPESLETVFLARNRLRSLPELSTPFIGRLDVSGNLLTDMPPLPSTGYLDCSDNLLADPPRFKDRLPSQGLLMHFNLFDADDCDALSLLNQTRGPSADFTYTPNRNGNAIDCTPPGFVSIPDPMLKRALLSRADEDADGELSAAEALSIQRVVIFRKPIFDLTGLASLHNLTTLQVDTAPVRVLPSLPPTLERLYLFQTELQAVAIDRLPNLTYVQLDENPALADLVATDLPALASLSASGSALTRATFADLPQLAKLNLDRNALRRPFPLAKAAPNLQDFNLSDNFLARFPDLAELPLLRAVNLTNNRFRDLRDLTANADFGFNANFSLALLEGNLLTPEDCGAIADLTSRGATMVHFEQQQGYLTLDCPEDGSP